ncbi:MAG: hypothetical protein ACI4MS_08180 [Candidatus Coproplasma sp.]
MNISEAIKTLDGVIPSPDNKMVDFEHLPIAIAWETVKTENERLNRLIDELEQDLVHSDELASEHTAKEILSYVGNLYDDCDQRFQLKDYQWHKRLCEKYGVEVEE